MEGQVIMSLNTYEKISYDLGTAKIQNESLLSQISDLKSGKGIFKVNKLCDNVYIELDELGAEILRNIASAYSETHNLPEIMAGDNVKTLYKKPEVNPNA